MSIVGIVAEFNPLHNGHTEIIEHAKEALGADAVVIAMSGNYTQRGECAVLDKYERAAHAINAGADLVFEIPVPTATATAELFAKSGVNILASSGVVDTLLFGAEDDNINLFFEAVKEENSLRNSFNTMPNNILGIEYIRTIDEYRLKLTPAVYKRRGAGHNERSFDYEYASSSAIREALQGCKPSLVKDYLPPYVYLSLNSAMEDHSLIFANDLSILLHERLISEDDFTEYADCNADLSDKINKHKDKYKSMTDFAFMLKSKDLRYSRIMRMLLHIALGIKKTHLTLMSEYSYAPYFRVLSFSKKGAALLSSIKKSTSLPIFASAKEGFKLLYDDRKVLLQLNIHCDDIYRILMTAKSSISYPTEFTRKFGS